MEKMLEFEGLKYISAPRPKNSKGTSYGGVALIVNTTKFSCEKLNVIVPSNLEVIWCLVRPKTQSTIFKSIIACSFYSPPNKKKNTKMADHIVSTLHMLKTKYPDSAIILGADKNQMDITPILNRSPYLPIHLAAVASSYSNSCGLDCTDRRVTGSC